MGGLGTENSMVFPLHPTCILREGGQSLTQKKSIFYGKSPGTCLSPKKEKTEEVGNKPYHIPLLAPSIEHLISSPHMQQEPSGAPLRGSHFHKRAMKKSVSVLRPGLHLAKSNKSHNNSPGFMYFKHGASSFQCIQICDM